MRATGRMAAGRALRLDLLADHGDVEARLADRVAAPRASPPCAAVEPSRLGQLAARGSPWPARSRIRGPDRPRAGSRARRPVAGRMRRAPRPRFRQPVIWRPRRSRSVRGRRRRSRRGRRGVRSGPMCRPADQTSRTIRSCPAKIRRRGSRRPSAPRDRRYRRRAPKGRPSGPPQSRLCRAPPPVRPRPPPRQTGAVRSRCRAGERGAGMVAEALGMVQLPQFFGQGDADVAVRPDRRCARPRPSSARRQRCRRPGSPR